MKVIKYQYLSAVLDEGELYFVGKEIPYSKENEEIVKAEAYNGVYEVYDDGKTEAEMQTPEQRIAELEEALALLLSGVTE